ncbi:MAG: hypothetical protein AB7P04_10640 [Bacteriovoracia bacterium]
MKTMNAVAASIAMLVTIGASAEVKPVGTRLAIEQAEMKVTKATQVYNQHENVDLVSYEFVGMEKKEIDMHFTMPDARTMPVTFEVKAVKAAGCGSQLIIAETAPPVHTGMSYTKERLELVDHRTRLCEDFRPYMWEAKVTKIRVTGFKEAVKGQLNLVGNPEALFHTMSVER